MPELPEVETIANSLKLGRDGAESILGQTIARTDLLWHKTLALPSFKQFERRIIGQTVQDTGRRGKYLKILLSRDVLLIHLRMSGDLIVGEGDQPLGSHPRLVLFMESGMQLSFTDTRKFGRVWLVEDPETILRNLGPEPLDSALTKEMFSERLLVRKRQIKQLLLDQSFIAGLGNIYTDEALHIAKIHPLTRASLLTQKQANLLFNTIRQILQKGIRRKGASFDSVYRGGGFQEIFQIYQRTDEPCLTCGTPISRIVIGQRGTHFCPNCQVQVLE
ncbi:MAG: DNA-formamidopyrimidine glycosylase [Chloroflexi bacterium]|nr:DNA-formamidopyrimidine glycosylase [Chloroflexota bacterium]